MTNVTAKLRQAVRLKLSHGTYLKGEIYDDAKRRWPDGSPITTSRVLSEEGNVINTLFSIYEVESWAEVVPG